MGVVYRGRDPKIGGRAVAIKLLRVDDDDALRERFLQEAAIAGNLNHDNIVTIYDFGEHEGQPYIVMEFIEGVTLADQIRSNFHFSLLRKLDLIHDLALALDYAHNRGIVHRDIKPANVMIDREDVLKVLDFGIARLGHSTMTLDGTMMGTPNYMSPEQVEGKAVDRRSDIFATGLVFYELLSYKQAFGNEAMHVILSRIVRDNPAPLAEVCSDLEPGLDAIVDRAIQKDPAARYQTMAAFAADVARIQDRIRRRAGDEDETIIIPSRDPQGSGPRTPRPTTPHRELISQRRLEIIEGHLRKAREAFDDGDYAAAADACEQAALIDPDDQRVLELLDRSKEALDRQRIRQLAEDAKAALQRGELQRASEFAAKAIEINPAAETALRIKKDVEAAQQQERGRQQEIVNALARARENLVQGRLESAIRAASDVLEQDPDNEEGHELTKQAFAALEERRERDARNRAARAAVDEQRLAFDAGRQREAIAALEQFQPAHEYVTAAIEQMRGELAEQERRRGEQQRWAQEQLETARAAVAGGEFIDGIALLRNIEREVPGTPGVADLLRDAQAAKAAADEQAKRQRQVADKLAGVTREVDAGRLTAALSLVNEALQLAPDDATVVARRDQVQQAIDAEQRAQDEKRQRTEAVNRHLAAATSALASANFDAARAALDAAEALEKDNRRASDLRKRLNKAVEDDRRAQEQRAREEERRRKDAERRAAAEERERQAAAEREKQATADREKQAAAKREKEAAEQREREAAAARDRAAAEQRERDAAAARERAAAEERQAAERAAAEERERAAAAERARVAAEEQERRAAGERERQAAAERERVAAAERDRKAAEERERKAAEERERKAAKERERQAAASGGQRPVAETVLATPATSEPARPRPAAEGAAVVTPPAPPVQRSGGPNPLVLGGAAAAVIAVVVAGWMFTRSSGTPETNATTTAVSTTPSTVPPTSVAATTSVPPTTAPEAPAVDTGAVVAETRRLLRNGDLTAAARRAVSGLKESPDARDIRDALGEVVTSAESKATTAKRMADGAGAASRPDYVQASAHLVAANRLRRGNAPDRAEDAVHEYLTAATMFGDAATQIAKLTTVAPTTVPPTPHTAPPSVTTQPPTSAATTTVPATTSAPATVDQATIRGLLQRYAQLSRSLDPAEIEQIYPGLNQRTKDQLDAFRKIYAYCDYTFSNIQIVSPSAVAPVVRADLQASCKAKSGRPPQPQPDRLEFRFQKSASGNWTISEILGVR